ncbi:MAG: hypothetical protein CL877_10040 [Dehalococcoidales bacterium]|nr:hypothetical protein [Dehalococcoidales bacterium]
MGYPPVFYNHVGDEGLPKKNITLIDAADKPHDPFIDQNFPQMNGIKFLLNPFREFASTFSEHMAVTRGSLGNLEDAASLAEAEGRAMLSATKSCLSRPKANGFPGCLSSTINLSILARSLWEDPSDDNTSSMIASSIFPLMTLPAIVSFTHLLGDLHQDPL